MHYNTEYMDSSNSGVREIGNWGSGNGREVGGRLVWSYCDVTKRTLLCIPLKTPLLGASRNELNPLRTVGCAHGNITSKQACYTEHETAEPFGGEEYAFLEAYTLKTLKVVDIFGEFHVDPTEITLVSRCYFIQLTALRSSPPK